MMTTENLKKLSTDESCAPQDWEAIQNVTWALQIASMESIYSKWPGSFLSLVFRLAIRFTNRSDFASWEDTECALETLLHTDLSDGLVEQESIDAYKALSDADRQALESAIFTAQGNLR